jgi:hypothetical protein
MYSIKTGRRIVPTSLDQIIKDVPKKRGMIAEILASTWRACTEARRQPPPLIVTAWIGLAAHQSKGVQS